MDMDEYYWRNTILPGVLQQCKCVSVHFISFLGEAAAVRGQGGQSL